MNNNQNDTVEVEGGEDPRKYFIILSNLVDDLGWTPFMLRLYLHYVRRIGGHLNGEYKNVVRVTAEDTDMSNASVVKARDELEKRGFIIVTRDREEGASEKSPRGVKITVRVIPLQDYQMVYYAAWKTWGQDKENNPKPPKIKGWTLAQLKEWCATGTVSESEQDEGDCSPDEQQLDDCSPHEQHCSPDEQSEGSIVRHANTIVRQGVTLEVTKEETNTEETIKEGTSPAQSESLSGDGFSAYPGFETFPIPNDPTRSTLWDALRHYGVEEPDDILTRYRRQDVEWQLKWLPARVALNTKPIDDLAAFLVASIKDEWTKPPEGEINRVEEPPF
jgi:hypothetical protein